MRYALEEKQLLGYPTLSAVVREVYQFKLEADRKADASGQPRKALSDCTWDFLTNRHGLSTVVQRRAWQLVQSAHRHIEAPDIAYFVDVLDGARSIDELSFFLYSREVLRRSVPSDSSAVPADCTSLSRSRELIDLLFADLPRAYGPACEDLARWAKKGDQMPTGELWRLVMETWRLCSLMLNAGKKRFSFEQIVLAFIQHDVFFHGTLRPREVVEAQEKRLGLSQDSHELRQVPVLPQATSLGKFLERFMRMNEVAPVLTELKVVGVSPDTAAQVCQVCTNCYSAFDAALAAYMQGLLHSDAPEDLAAHSSLAEHLFSFQAATQRGDPVESLFSLRSLLVILTAHQADCARQTGAVDARQADADLRAQLRVVRSHWEKKQGLAVTLEAPPEAAVTEPAPEPPKPAKKQVRLAQGAIGSRRLVESPEGPATLDTRVEMAQVDILLS